MKTIASLLMSIALASSAFAGSPAYSEKGTVPPAPEPSCFDPGFSIGVFGGGFLPNHQPSGFEDALGGGALAEYFFTENFGIQASYGAYASSSTQHVFNGDFILRAPIHSICVAPYLMAGGGLHVDGSKFGDYHFGAGLEAQFKSLNNVGVFADGAYYFHSSGSRDRDFTVVRLGVKFHL